MAKAKTIDVDVWARDDVIESFSFSDGYKYVGKDASKKMMEYTKGKKPGKMRIHPL